MGHQDGDLSADDVEALRAAALEIANQEGRGLRRRTLLNLAGRPFSISVLGPNANGDPVVAVVQARRWGFTDSVGRSLLMRRSSNPLLVGASVSQPAAE